MPPQTPALTAISEDAGAPSGAVGTLVSALVDFASPAGQVDNVTDPDAGALLGIAVTAADTTNGSWYYSINGGTNWNALGAVATNNARLLAADANTRLYFQPNANYSGTLATRSPSGPGTRPAAATGALADTTTNGGITAFSTATDVASLTVNAVNDAPVLDNTKSPALTAQNEDSGAPSGAVGTLVSSLVDFASPAGQVDNVTDADSGRPAGHRGHRGRHGQRQLVLLDQRRHELERPGGRGHQQRPAAGGRRQHAALLPAQRQLQRHAGQRHHLPRLGPDQRQQRRAGRHHDQRRHHRLLHRHRHGQPGRSTPVADTPSVTNATTNEDTQTTSGLVISRNAADSTEVTHFKITGITNGTLYKNDGMTQITSGTFITFAEGNAGLKFTPTANFSGSGSFTIQASTSNGDAGLGGSTVNATITVNAVADTPSVTNATTNEDTQSTSGLVISRNAADSTEVTHFKITGITNGTLYKNDGVTQITSGTFITFAEGNAGLKFTPTANFNGSGSFTIQASKSNGDAGLGGSTVNATITVNAVNDAPTLGNGTLAAVVEDTASPAGQTVTTIFTGQFADIDAGSSFGGIAVVGNTANAGTQGTWQYSTNAGTNWFALGTVTDGATALAVSSATLIRFLPVANYNGTPPALVVRGLDNTYAGGWSTTAGSESRVTVNTTTNGGTTAIAAATANLSTSITAVADTPSVTNATTNEDTQTTSGLVISRNAADSTEVTHFKITGITNGTLYKNDGVTQITSGTFITFAEGNAGLKFTPTANFSGSGSFTIQASTSNGDAGLGGSTVNATITVTAVADTPSVTNATTNEDTQSTSGLVISRNAADSTEVTHFKITGITNGTLYKNDGATQITSGTFITFAEGNAGLKFTPTANFNGSGSFTIQASKSNGDAGLGGSTVNATITVNAVNDAPTLGNGTLAAVVEDTASPAGQTVTTIFTGQFADIDAGSSFGGIAVVGNTANAGTQGTWQYSTNAGSNWFALGTVTDGATALAVSSATLIRFLPVANYNGTPPALVVRGLDNTYAGGWSTTAGSESRVTVNTTTNGGTTAIAAATANLSTSITAVADTPSVTNATTNEDTQTTAAW